MFQVDSIIAAAAVAFHADANMIAMCPGGLWHRRAASTDQGVKRPYGVVAVTSGEKEYLSSKDCVQPFTLAITIYGDEKTDNTGMIASYLCAWDLDRALFASLPARVLGFTPASEVLDLDPEEKEGKDVVIAMKVWTLLLHFITQTVPV